MNKIDTLNLLYKNIAIITLRLTFSKKSKNMLKTCLGSCIGITWKAKQVLLFFFLDTVLFLDHKHLCLKYKCKGSLLSLKIKKNWSKLTKSLRTFWGSLGQNFKNVEAEPLFQLSYKTNWVYRLKLCKFSHSLSVIMQVLVR